MSSILFWMIFIQVSIFFISAGVLVSWLVFEPRESRKSSRYYRLRRSLQSFGSSGMEPVLIEVRNK